MTYEEYKAIENKIPSAFVGTIKSESDLNNTSIVSISSNLYTKDFGCFYYTNSSYRLSVLEAQEYLDFAKLDAVLLKMSEEQKRKRQIEQDFTE